MKTSEDAPRSGLFVSRCCDEELVFCKGDTLLRCPRCHYVCEWELVEIAFFPEDLERLQATDSERALQLRFL